MEWSADVDAGDWLRGRIDDPWRNTMHDVVPRGFPAYARIAHPEQEQGWLDSGLLAVLAGHLAAHTSVPDDVFVAVWEGWGGMLGFLGDAPSRSLLVAADEAVSVRHTAMLGRSFTDRFNNVFRRATWQEGVLSREVSEGPRLELPGRGHVLFRGSLAELAAPGWPDHVPWNDPGGAFPQSPSLIWPADRTWVSVTDVDADATLVGGSAELVAAVAADERLDARPIPEGATLHDPAGEASGTTESGPVR